MPMRIEDYAVIGDCHGAALVGRDGSIDWLCLPRFDSGACFAALLGDPSHGRWLIAPAAKARRIRRRYRPGTLILETEFDMVDGAVRIIDFMPLTSHSRDVVRIVEGLSGRVAIDMELIVRFDYGSIIPWVQHIGDGIRATAGPHALELRSTVATHGQDMKTVAHFQVAQHERVAFTLNYHRSYEAPKKAFDVEQTLVSTEKSWRDWSERCTFKGRWHDEALRSLITLKALTYAPTGGLVAAPTTSLPEQWRGKRNWDYRYCWLRDATFTLNAMLLAGYHEEGSAWLKWLERAVGGPSDVNILYSITGERRLDEYEVGWLPGYMNAAPVRVGNAACKQLQLDVYGELMDTFHLSRLAGLKPGPEVWKIQVALLKFLEDNWQKPDEGIWEVRGPRRHFTHSKMMAWVAFDRAIKDAEAFGFDGPVERWRQARDAIHAQVCTDGYDAHVNAFMQSYGSPHLDASLLLMPQVGFLPPDDPRVVGTIQAIEHNLIVDGLVLRYSNAAQLDELPPGESAFLPCSFWMADALVLIGRREDGESLFQRLLALCNDVGLLSEEYDSKRRHMSGNFPQALTHMALINTASLLSMSPERTRRAGQRRERPTATGVV